MAKDKQGVLDDIFANDPFDLLALKSVSHPPLNEDDRLIASFKMINTFYAQHQRAPNSQGDIQEMQLYSRLTAIQQDPEKIRLVMPHDQFNLLTQHPVDFSACSYGVEINSIPKKTPPLAKSHVSKPIQSLDDIFNDEMFNTLVDHDSEINALFEIKNIPTQNEIDARASADFVARRKPCKDFKQYEKIFNTVQQELREGKRKLVPFKQDNLDQGVFYVHNGILLFLESIEFQEEVMAFKSGKRQRKDGRTRIIFENGTESNMLYRSLYKALSLNGYGVSESNEQTNAQFIENFNTKVEKDEADHKTGFLYILQTRSERADIQAIPNLYKIGFSSTDIKQRLKNAAQEPTYLMADVKLIRAYECYNMNPQKFEKMLHYFFGDSCLDIDVFDKNGKRHTPREWFIAPLSIIENAIGLILAGEISQHRYDAIYELIVKR